MEMLRKLSSHSDLKHIYQMFIRSLLEQASTVWHSCLIVEFEKDLKRVQKVALKIILKDKYQSYENTLLILDLEKLKERRTRLSLSFC